MPRVSGIYAIVNRVSHWVYIGQTQDVNTRWAQHCRLLRKNRHNNPHLQNAWNKYGEHNFYYTVLEECSLESLNYSEQRWFEITSPKYNISRIPGHSMRGIPKSAEVRERISKANKGKRRSTESRVKQSNTMKGRKDSPERVERRAASTRGRKHTYDERRKMSERHMARLGKKTITQKDSDTIRAERKSGALIRELVERWGFSRATIKRIIYNQTWVGENEDNRG